MLSEDQIVQLTIAAVLAVILFVFAYGLPQKVAAIGLIVLIPFQPIETQFATANVLLTFVVFIAMLMRREKVYLPLLPQILVLLFVFMVSTSQVYSPTFSYHAIYMFSLLSAILVFWLAYDLTLRFENLRSVVHVFIAINLLVLVYSAVQMWRGYDVPLTFFGFSEMSMEAAREDGRITGPFGGSGMLAEYFVTSIYLVLYQFLTTTQPRHRLGLGLLTIANIAFLISTASRGGFLTFVVAGGLFLWMFRKELGVARVAGIVSGGVVALLLVGALIVNYTEFGGLYERLAETEVQEGIPDTRQRVWPAAWKEIQNHPVLGHGPRLRFPGEEDGQRYKGHVYIQYPHNLYLFLLFTVGVVGLLAFLAFFLTPLRRCWQVGHQWGVDPYAAGLAKTGVVVVAAILIDQMKVEFLRINMTDYWHYIFALLGMLVAVCDRGRGFTRAEAA